MDSTYAESRRPSRDTIRNGYVEDDINIPHRGMLQSARRLQETRALLASPGPLESMLKTTTETGDIGMYSIRPSRSSSSARTPLHPIASPGGSVLVRTTSMNTPGRGYFRDDRRDLPSYRDTTSEIISLYASNGQRSMPASLSRSPDDPGPRSHSLTSCSSRYMSDQKSIGTWDSRSSGGSGGVLARPRSPYPYHTRLKRPGVRPSSPALTMDGNIDYSRMVEVDRPSYRTIHRSYGRSYPPNPPRHPHPHPHLRHRPFDSRAARSLPGDVDTFTLSRHGSVAAPPHAPWVSDAHDQLETSSSDQSAGVSSITSIVQMHASPAVPPIAGQPSIPRTGSFYYDYSEDFQEHSVPVPCEPVSPMPRRGPSMYRSVVLDDSCEPIDSAATSMKDATANRLPSVGPASPTRSHSEHENHFPKVVVQCQSEQEDATYEDSTDTSPPTEATTGGGVQVSRHMGSDCSDPRTSTMVSEGGGASTVEAAGSFFNASEGPETAHSGKQEEPQVDNDEVNVPDNATSATHLASDHPNTEDHPVGDAIEDTPPETPSASTDSAASRGSESTRHSSGNPETPSLAARRRSNVYSLQPGLMDLKSFVQDLDDAGLLHDADVSGNSLNRTQISSSPAKLTAGANVTALLARTNKVLEADSDRISTYRSMRESAVSSAITRLKTDVMSERRQSADDTKSVILAPQPVSPARQLRLRSSVSKLMKALPPVPPASDQESTVIDPLAERKLPELPAAPRVSLPESGQAGSAPKLGSFDRAHDRQGGLPSAALSGNAGTGRTGNNNSSHDIYGDIWHMHFGRADDLRATHAGTESSGTIAPDMMKGEEDSLGTRAISGTGTRQLHSLTRRGNFKSSTLRSKPIRRENPAHLNSISQPRGASLDTSRSTFQRPPVPPKHPVPVNKNALVDNEIKPQRGLKKRLSDFRIRLTESRHRPVDWSSPGARVHMDDGEVIGVAIPVTSSTGSPESGGITTDSNSPTDDSSARGLRHKLSRWLKSAKNAVNSCKRLSSSTGGASLDTDF